MSRRRPTTDAPLVGGPHLRREDRGLFPADKDATVDLIDPQGHRLLRVGRSLDEADPTMIWLDADSRGENVTLAEVPGPSATGPPVSLWFQCKACRDAGHPMLTYVSYQALVSLVTECWDEATKRGTPRRASLSSVVP